MTDHDGVISIDAAPAGAVDTLTGLAPELRARMDAYWRAANYLSVGKIYLCERDLDMFYIAGPGHGGPALVANTHLEGSCSEVYPNISRDEAGRQKLFKQFSFPGGISSHVHDTHRVGIRSLPLGLRPRLVPRHRPDQAARLPAPRLLDSSWSD